MDCKQNEFSHNYKRFGTFEMTKWFIKAFNVPIITITVQLTRCACVLGVEQRNTL